MSESWFSLGRHMDREVLVKAWVAGDGLSCSSSNGRCRRPCGPPAAVIETLWYGDGRYKRVDDDGVQKRILRVVCAEHLAGLVGADGFTNARGSAIGRASKRASEEVISKHWKQYEALYEKAYREEMDSLFSGIPSSLRALIEALPASENEEVER